MYPAQVLASTHCFYMCMKWQVFVEVHGRGQRQIQLEDGPGYSTVLKKLAATRVITGLSLITPTPRMQTICWVLPPLSNSWIIIILWLYIALNRTLNIDCYWVGAVPKPYESHKIITGS